MRTSKDPRHLKRRENIKSLYAQSFLKQKIKNQYIETIKKKLIQIDNIIKKIAPEFPIDKINKVDLAILRLAIYELEFEKKEPEKVIVDEAIELAKEFGGETSPAFINGALANLLSKK